MSGLEVTTNGQRAIDALKNNNTFRTVGIALRDERPSNESLALAAARMTELIGDDVLPLEDQISTAAAKYFAKTQSRITILAEKLARLDLPGGERMRELYTELSDILLSDASEAPARLGSEESALFDDLSWGTRVEQRLRDGLEETVRDLQRHHDEIDAMPALGTTGQLQDNLTEEFARLNELLSQEDFHQRADDLNSLLTDIRAAAGESAELMKSSLQNSIKQAEVALQLFSGWSELNHEEKSQAFSQLGEISTEASDDLDGLKVLLRRESELSFLVGGIRERIQRLGQKRRLERLEEEREKARREGKEKITRTIFVPRSIMTKSEFDDLLRELKDLDADLSIYSEIEVFFEMKDEE